MNTALWISIVGAIFCAIIAVFIENKENNYIYYGEISNGKR